MAPEAPRLGRMGAGTILGFEVLCRHFSNLGARIIRENAWLPNPARSPAVGARYDRYI